MWFIIIHNSYLKSRPSILRICQSYKILSNGESPLTLKVSRIPTNSHGHLKTVLALSTRLSYLQQVKNRTLTLWVFSENIIVGKIIFKCFYFILFFRQKIRWTRGRCLVFGCDPVHTSQRFPALWRVDPEGTPGTGVAREVPDPVLHVDGLWKSAQKIPRSQSGAEGQSGGEFGNIFTTQPSNEINRNIFLKKSRLTFNLSLLLRAIQA